MRGWSRTVGMNAQYHSHQREQLLKAGVLDSPMHNTGESLCQEKLLFTSLATGNLLKHFSFLARLLWKLVKSELLL